MVSSQTIPAWFVASMMIYAGFMWLISRKSEVRMDSRIIGFTLILEAIMYGIVFQFYSVSVEVRGFFARLMIIILCLSQSLPLTISYFRSLNRGD